MKKIIFVAGARPNFMKIAPIIRAFGSRKGTAGFPDVTTPIVHTGQHYDPIMSEIFFSDLMIPEPEWNLEVGSASHAVQTARVMTGFEELLLTEKPDMVVVVGDVNSTIACALTSAKMGVPVSHVEAGLRSFDREMPEEINRVLTDAISDILFVTEPDGVENLAREGVDASRVHLVGNVMIDSLHFTLGKVDRGEHILSDTVAQRVSSDEPYAVLTLHRPSNVDQPDTFRAIWDVIEEIAGRIPVIFPVHPRTAGRMKEFGILVNSVTLTEPVGYADMAALTRGAAMMLTDSGGLQEETTALGVPCVTIRNNTERPVTVTEGTNYLAGTDPEAIREAAMRILDGEGKPGKVPELWDGSAAERITSILVEAI
jgi:UDP-N-acetylglucosamine 2-epimerase (non-hydrolysing)